jgi:hypothetical protein
MQNDILASLARLHDSELVAHMKTLLARERGATAETIAHLAELDTRDLHLREGYDSLYAYCRDVLGLSEWEAYNRIEVARVARRFPAVLAMLAEGSIHLTAVKRLGPHLTPGNHREVLESARGKSKAEVQEIVARLAPRPDVPSSVRRLPRPQEGVPVSTESSPAPTPGAMGRVGAGGAGEPGLATPVPHAGPGQAPEAAHAVSSAGLGLGISRTAVTVTPLSPDRYKLQVTIGGETLERLRLAKDMLGHALPSGDDAAVLDRALRALLAELARKKFGGVGKSRPRQQPSGKSKGEGTQMDDPAGQRSQAGNGRAVVGKVPPRSPSAAVKRAVWLRDLGRCAFVGAGGHRCGERRFVEFHHVDPYALGGEATIDGIQLRCRRHNDYEGRLYFGDRRRGRTCSGTSTSGAQRAHEQGSGRVAS